MSEIIREISASTAIRFGTTEPYAMGGAVKMRSIGFADLKMAELTVTAPGRFPECANPDHAPTALQYA